jgi:hypothetical protein
MFDESLFDDDAAVVPVTTRENHKAAKCHPESRHAARGLCFSCYVKQYPKAKRASCHPGRIAKTGGLCKSCVDRKLKIENPGYAERQAQNNRNWTKDNAARISEWQTDYQSIPRVRGRKSELGRSRTLAGFSLTPEDEVLILARQGGGCGVCGGESQRAYYDLDHCHETGTVRGLLCGRCNKGLGLLGDNEEAVMRALEYLRSHSKASINE